VTKDSTNAQGTSPRVGLTEAVLLAFATAVVYLATGSKQLGYQDAFGFTYLNIGVEDLTWTFYSFVIPIAFAVVFVLIFALVFRLVAGLLKFPVSVAWAAFPLFPIAAIVSLLIFYPQDIFSFVSEPFIYFYLLIIYYIIDPLVLRLLTWPSPQLREALPTAEQLHVGQVIVASILFIAFAYDSGRREAFCPDYVETCVDVLPGESPRLQVQRAGDIAVCAKVDWVNKSVYADFTYAKIDPKKPARFRRTDFNPECIGVLPQDPGVPPESLKCDVNKKIDAGKCPKRNRS
jgi:hypothetical protein